MRLAKQRKSALYIGYSLIIMTIAAMVAMGAIFAPLFEAESSEYSSLLNGKEHLYLIGLILWGVIFITDLIVSIAVCKYYRSKDQKKASISAGLRLMYTLILGYAIVYLVIGYVELISANVNYNVVHENLLRFQSIWLNGLIIFGLHLITLSPLVCKKRSVQMVISILLLIAGVGYVSSNSLALLITDYESIRDDVEAVFILPMILGELSFAIWMLAKGGRDSVLDQPLSDAA